MQNLSSENSDQIDQKSRVEIDAKFEFREFSNNLLC